MKKFEFAGWTITIPKQLIVNQRHEITDIPLKDIELMTDDEWQAELKARKTLRKMMELTASACCIGLFQNGQKPVKRSKRKKTKTS